MLFFVVRQECRLRSMVDSEEVGYFLHICPVLFTALAGACSDVSAHNEFFLRMVLSDELTPSSKGFDCCKKCAFQYKVVRVGWRVKLANLAVIGIKMLDTFSC